MSRKVVLYFVRIHAALFYDRGRDTMYSTRVRTRRHYYGDIGGDLVYCPDMEHQGTGRRPEVHVDHGNRSRSDEASDSLI